LKGAPHKASVDRIQKLARRKNVKLPESFESTKNEFSLSGLELFWVAFWDLRSATPDESPIPWSEREGWARAYGLDWEQRSRLHSHIAAMDAEFRKWLRKKSESGTRSTGGGLARGRRK
jgi:hypothetical protein